MRIHTIGLQRSGTNYVGQLVKMNLTDDVIPSGDRSICWKHSLPNEKTPSGITAIESVRKHRDSVLVVLVAKHPLHWVASITKRTPQDLFMKRPELCGDGTPDLPALMGLYNSFYSSWVELMRDHMPHAVVRYEDSLIDPAGTLGRISTVIGVPTPDRIALPERVPFSNPLPEKRKALYMKGDHGLSATEADAVRSYVNGDLLAEIGYRVEGPPAQKALSPL